MVSTSVGSSKGAVDYNTIAAPYKTHRNPDPRIASRIWAHTAGACTVLNVGAGAGGYEPPECRVVAVEPSAEMISQRQGSHAAPVRGVAEALPFSDASFDASMAVLTVHHWSDPVSGLKEMQRVTRHKMILFTWIGYGHDFWLEDYVPEIRGVDEKLFPSLKTLERILGPISVETVEIPHDCTDGFMCAYWRRPAAYLDRSVRQAISTFSRIPDVQGRLNRLQKDITSGLWRMKYGHLLEKEGLDLGYRLVCAAVGNARQPAV